MFNRVDYKKRAWANLSGSWKVPLLVNLTVICITGLLSAPYVRSQFAFLGEFNVAPNIGFIFSIISSVVSGIFAFGTAYFYLSFNNDKKVTSYNTFLTGLSDALRGILAYLWMYLWVFLWALLFIIPGIVKLFSYSQMFFILAENPTCSVRKSMKISMAITRGHKFDLFVMLLSFIPWFLLSAITLGIVFFWIKAYIESSFVNAYKEMKDEALASGRILPSDFGGPEITEQKVETTTE